MAIDTFSEVALITITRQGGTDTSYAAIIESFKESGGAKDFESIATTSGGRLKKFNPQEDFEVTIEGYGLEIGTDTGTTGLGWYDLMHTEDTSQPMSISVDRTRDNFRLSIMVTDNASQTSATAVTVTGDKAMRKTYKNGHFTNVESDFGDKVMKFSITFKCPPFDSSGSANVTYESTDGTDAKVLPAISTYT
jgi:hypothetical protein